MSRIDDPLSLDPGDDVPDTPLSPSPKNGTTSNSLGLGLPPSLTSGQNPSVLTTYPHLGHYIFNLLASIQTSPPRGAVSQHPLSVSSSGGDEDGEAEQRTPQKKRDGPGESSGDRGDLVRKVVVMLDNEEGEEVKDLLKPHMGELGKVSQGGAPDTEA